MPLRILSTQWSYIKRLALFWNLWKEGAAVFTNHHSQFSVDGSDDQEGQGGNGNGNGNRRRAGGGEEEETEEEMEMGKGKRETKKI
jgi:hypothetical protein